MDIVFIIIFILFANYLLVNFLKGADSTISASYLWILFGVHFFLSTVYFIYAGLTASDSYAYYRVSSESIEWLPFFQVGSPFIRFLAWPFTGFLHIGYYAVMILFSYFGYIGVALFYYAAKENIQLQKEYNGLTVLEWVFLLPNIHFWSSSLGKGSVMVLGIGLLIFGLSRFNYRFLQIIIGAFIIYFVRPHILFAALGGIVIGLSLAGNGISKGIKYSLIAITFISIFFLTDKVLEFADTDSINILESKAIAHKAQELGKSKSGIDLSSYNPIEKILTFWFRPLFFDAPGVMGVIVSFENLLVVILFFKTIKVVITKSKILNGWFLLCFFIFLLGSFALSQVSGNLGIAMRQKAQLMPLFFIVYAKCMSINENIS